MCAWVDFPPELSDFLVVESLAEVRKTIFETVPEKLDLGIILTCVVNLSTSSLPVRFLTVHLQSSTLLRWEKTFRPLFTSWRILKKIHKTLWENGHVPSSFHKIITQKSLVFLCEKITSLFYDVFCSFALLPFFVGYYF